MKKHARGGGGGAVISKQKEIFNKLVDERLGEITK